MGKYIFGAVVILAIFAGAFVFGYAAGVTANGGRVCEMDENARTQEQVCIVDGVTYTPEDTDD